MPTARALAVAGAAVALPLHVEPQASEAPAAARFTFAFEVEHGCDGSPTVEVAIRLPPGSSDIVPVEKPGWTAEVDDADPPVVTFLGGPLGPDVADTFAVELLTPNEPGEEVLFPTIQVCEAGELAWIEAEPGGDSPAPRVRLVENPEPVVSSTTAPTGPSTTPVPPSTTEPSAIVGDEHDEDEGRSGGAAVVAAVVVAAAVGFAVRAARRRRL